MQGESPSARIAVVGDVHLHWSAEDVRYFDEAGYDLVLFVGDLAGYSRRGGEAVARSMASMRTPAIVIPGNHDGVNLGQLISEVFPRLRALRRPLAVGQGARCRRLDAALAGVTMGGYSHHPLELGRVKLNLVVGRPHSMGGAGLGFAPYLAARFAVDSVEASAARISGLVDECDEAPILFLAHNGPAGLGSAREDIWGCDFRASAGDWGDVDLRLAVEHARASGRDVLGVVAGHMHHHLRGGGRRPWRLERDGVLYLNAARVPRVFEGREGGGTLRHHLRLKTCGERIEAEEVLVPSTGQS